MVGHFWILTILPVVHLLGSYPPMLFCFYHCRFTCMAQSMIWLFLTGNTHFASGLGSIKMQMYRLQENSLFSLIYLNSGQKWMTFSVLQLWLRYMSDLLWHSHKHLLLKVATSEEFPFKFLPCYIDQLDRCEWYPRLHMSTHYSGRPFNSCFLAKLRKIGPWLYHARQVWTIVKQSTLRSSNFPQGGMISRNTSTSFIAPEPIGAS
jgi:hypothetical protein